MITDESANDLCMVSSVQTIPPASWRTVKDTRKEELIAWALLAPFIFKSNMGVYYWKEGNSSRRRTTTNPPLLDTPLIHPVDGTEQWIQCVRISQTYQLHQPAWERLQAWTKTLES